MARLSRAEALLLGTASTVLVAAVVAVPFLYDDDGGPPSSAPAPTPTVSPSPSPLPVLSVRQLRVTTYARGSHQLVVRARVSTGASASLLVGGTSFPMHLIGGEVTGTVRVACGGPVPELTLVVRTAEGSMQSASLGRPAAPFAQACATPRPGAPVPTGTPLSS